MLQSLLCVFLLSRGSEQLKTSAITPASSLSTSGCCCANTCTQATHEAAGSVAIQAQHQKNQWSLPNVALGPMMTGLPCAT